MEATGTPEDPSWKHPHAFHLNLPAHHLDEDGIPLITKYASKKSRHILALARSMELTEAMFVNDHDVELDDDEGSQADDTDHQDSLHAFCHKCIRLQSQLSSLESLKHSGSHALNSRRLFYIF